MFVRESVRIGDKVVTLETGRIAKQAGGSILATCGETVVLVTCCGSQDSKPGQSFLPLSVEYVEKTYAAGKIPGGFFKREGKLRDSEVLVSRLIDRPARPLFPEGWFGEIQVVATVMSVDKVNPSDVVAMTAASAAIHLSQVPWAGPIAGVRVGRVDGRYIANPTYDELKQSDMDLIISASRDAIVMVEGEANEISEADMLGAIEFGKAAVQDVLSLIDRMREVAGKPKWASPVITKNAHLEQRVREASLLGVREACNTREKFARYGSFKLVKKATVAQLAPEFPGQEKDIGDAFEELKYETMRNQVVFDKSRVDGRDLVTVRPISIELGLLPRVHGSALFTRGETQAIVTATLGTRQDEQRMDGIIEESWKRFLLHYNFPPYSVGETKPMRGPGRREIGHGNLAERALAKLMPTHEQFPYTVRIVSEITESNGSSSMASVCGGSLAMMEAGVPLRAPVAGVAMGLIMQGADYAVLTDILGDEDALGDMDFKVCGTSKGITAIQMDIKIAGLSFDIMRQALAQARDGRLHILGKMAELITEGRTELSKYAPRITQVKVKPDQIRSIIGPGGKMIKAIVDQTGAKIDVSDDGTVSISSSDSEAVKKAIAIIESLTTSPEVGQKYKGIVKRVERYGAFVEIAPGTDGLLHITDMDWGFVQNPEDIAKLGDELEVVVTNVDRDGKIRLSRKALLDRPEGMSEHGDGGGHRGRDDGDRRPPRRDDGDRHPPRHDRDEAPRRDVREARSEAPRREVREERPEAPPRRDVREERPEAPPRRDTAEQVVEAPRERDDERDKRRVEREARRVERDKERDTRRVERDVEPAAVTARDSIPPARVEEPRRDRHAESADRPAPKAREERPSRGRDEVRDDRPARGRDDARDDRPARPRDESRAPVRDDRPARGRDEARPPVLRDDVRDDRPARGRDDARPHAQRDDVRDDRPARGRDDSRAPLRDDRPTRGRDDVRDDRPTRGRDDVRDDRPARARDDARDDRPARARDDARDDRPARGRDDARDDRPARGRDDARDDRPARGRDDRPARGRDDGQTAAVSPRMERPSRGRDESRDDRPSPARGRDDGRASAPSRGRDEAPDDRSSRTREPVRSDRPARDDGRGARPAETGDRRPPRRDYDDDVLYSAPARGEAPRRDAPRAEFDDVRRDAPSPRRPRDYDDVRPSPARHDRELPRATAEDVRREPPRREPPRRDADAARREQPPVRRPRDYDDED